MEPQSTLRVSCWEEDLGFPSEEAQERGRAGGRARTRGETASAPELALPTPGLVGSFPGAAAATGGGEEPQNGDGDLSRTGTGTTEQVRKERVLLLLISHLGLKPGPRRGHRGTSSQDRAPSWPWP